jgi:Ca2+-transporting ATPase
LAATVKSNSGLSARQAGLRLAADGANALPQQKPRNLAQIAFSTIREPMFALLLASGLIYLLLGSLEESLFLLFFACSSVGIAVVQEGRSERVLNALRELTSPRALVIRDNVRMRIASREIVHGDLIVLAEGDRIPADAILLQADDLLADESLLTGEAIPVRKRVAEGTVPGPASPGGEDLPFVFSSTLVVRGSGLAEVTATGPRSRIGQIGKTLAGIETATPRLTLETRRVVRVIALLGMLVCVIATVLFGLFRGSWLQAVLAGIALGMSMVPEEFPLVLTVFMVMGAWRLSRVRILTRRASAIESLGAATVLCTDKTGTLTENRMSIAEIRAGGLVARPSDGKVGDPGGMMAGIIECGVLASATDPFDPMEKAFHALKQQFVSPASTTAERSLSKVYPLRRELLAVAQAWRQSGTDGFLIATKGAPEAIAGLCHLDAQQMLAVQCDIDEMAAAGMRVLGVAEARHPGPDLPDSPSSFAFQFLGLVGLADPIRASVPAAIRECQSAGIRVIMITGDYPLTARAIGTQAGLPDGELVSGSALDSMSEAALQDMLGRANIFARIAPEQKLRLVQGLRARGDVVAMTGDGVNDAPALRAADIGVAMGNRGTDVAREASAIVRTIRLGRRIYDNLRKAMGYIIAVHMPIAGLALLPLLTGMPLILAPIHIAFLEIIIDPVCSIVFEAEPEEPNVMQRPPRSPKANILSPSLIKWSVIQGLIALLIVATVYVLGYRLHMRDTDLRTLTFITLVCGNLSLALVNRSFSASGFGLFKGATKIFWVIAVGVIAVLAVATLWSPARALFEFGAFHGHDLFFVVISALSLVLVLESIKALWPARFQSALAG